MFLNYLKITFRSLRKNVSYLVINTLGLGLSMACCIAAYLLLAYNLEFDDHFDNKETNDIFTLHSYVEYADGNWGHHLVAPINLGPEMAATVSGVRNFTRYNYIAGFVGYEDKAFNEVISFADSSFFELFGFVERQGSVRSFSNRQTAIISEAYAQKYFEGEDPVGKTLTLNFSNNHEVKVNVGGVIEKTPNNSTFVFDILIRIEHFYDIYGLTGSDWGDWRDPALFVRLDNPDQAANTSDLLAPFVALRNKMKTDLTVRSFQLEPFKRAYNVDEINWSQTNLRVSTIALIVFTVMASLILLVACFNLANTSFAMAARRLKEVGVRKVLGASRKHIVNQFLLEMVITVSLALIAGVVFSNFIVPEFAAMWGLPYGLSDLNGLNLLIALLILVALTSLISGVYPAVFNSKLQPIKLLKGGMKVKGTNFFTRTLVALQFVISVIVLINGIVFIQNTKFQESVDFGFNMKDVLAITILNQTDYEVMRNRLSSSNDVEDMAITHHQLGLSSYPFPVTIDTTEYQVQHIEVGENFFETMGLKLESGRFLNTDYANDHTASLVVNEAFVERTNLEDPLNKTVILRGQRMKIVGVVANHVDNLFRSREPEPFVYYVSKPNEYQLMLVKGVEGSLNEIQNTAEAIWKEEFPERPFLSQRQEDLALGTLRQANSSLKKIFIFLTILGGLLSASGIFALASLNVEKRTKEIGIRKTLGASIRQIILILSRDFSTILVIAAILGGVGGYFLSSTLLQQIYAYYMVIGIFPIAAGVLMLLVLGFGTTSTTIFKAANANPIQSLRDE